MALLMRGVTRFYAEITGGVAKGDEYWALVEGPNGDIGFQQIDDYRPPTWPDGEVGIQMHIEFLVDDLDATGARVLAGWRYPIRASAQRRPLLCVRRPGRASVLPVNVGAPRVGD
jgi:hypothetical protein